MDRGLSPELYPLTYDAAHRFVQGQSVRLGRLMLPGKATIKLLEAGIFPTVEEASDDTPAAA